MDRNGQIRALFIRANLLHHYSNYFNAEGSVNQFLTVLESKPTTKIEGYYTHVFIVYSLY